MRPTAHRIHILVTAALLVVAAGAVAGAAGHAPPSRPPAAHAAAAVSPRPASQPAVPVSEIAGQLALRGSWSEPGRKITLADGNRKLELEADSRECLINGLRFFLGQPVTARHGMLYVDAVDYRNCLVPLLRPALAAGRPHRPRIVAIDPGHGGVDRGTENPKLGLQEKTFTLDVARRLRRLLENRGFAVVLTRDADERVENSQRALIANRAHADLFVSIHFNSLYPDTKTTGAEVFTFTRPGQRSDSSRGLGQPDDTEDGPAPVNRFDPWSVALADALHRATVTQLKLPDRGQKTKHLGMLRSLDCPGALVESGFLSNEEEARKIATPAYRQRIAEALAAAIENYAGLVQSLGGKA